MSKQAAIKVSGLNELRKELKAADSKYGPELKAINVSVVEDVVLPEVRQRAAGAFTRRAGQKPVRVGHAVIETLRAVKSERGAYIQLGGNKAPQAVGFEFGSLGGKTKKGGHTNQFPQWKGNKAGAGYFVWPAIRAKQTEIQDKYLRLIDELTSRAFPD